MLNRFFIWSLFLIFCFPSLAKAFEAQINLVNFPQEQEAKIHQAVDLIKKVVTSPEFKQRVLSHTYNGEKIYVDNKGLTNEQIYQLIVDGSETLIPGKNGRMDVELELYQNSSNT